MNLFGWLYAPLTAAVACCSFVLAPGVSAQAQETTIVTDVTTEAKPWTNLDFNNDPDVFQFAIVSDNAGGPRQGVFSEAVYKLNNLQPEFVMSVGDFIEGYEPTHELIDAQWDGFMTEVGNFEVPFFFVPGNHDIGKPMWAEVYHRRFGRSYYHFLYEDVLFLCLNSNDGSDYSTGFGQEQIDYVGRVLSKYTDVRWTLVFQHKPLWNDEGNAGWKQIEQHLAGRKCTVFAGHTHNYLSQEKDGISYITLATTGGGSGLRGSALGEFDQIAWVTMKEEGPRVANLLLDGILEKDVRTPETVRSLALFRGGRAVTASPVFSETSNFVSGESTLKITNPSEQPLRIKVLSEVQPGVRVEPGSVSVIIPGGEEHSVNLRITSDQPVPVPQVQPVVLHWTANYDHGNNTASTQITGQACIPIDTNHEIPSLAAAVKVDGDLSDWSDLPFVVDQPGEVWHNPPGWRGPQDGSFRFGVGADAEFLYVAIKTADNEPSFDGWKYWEDFALFWFDGRANPEADPKDAIFAMMVGPEIDDLQKEEYSEGKAPDGTLSASAKTETGFTAEFALPLAYLKERQGGDWSRVRLNIGFSDFDKNETRDGVTILYWRPQWGRAAGAAESGVFLRTVD